MIARRVQISDRHWTMWIAGLWGLVLFAAYGPSIERNVFPVVSKFEIVQIEQDGVGSRVYARFEKWRSCEYLGINWNRIRPDGTRQRVFLNLKPADDMSGSTRPKGAHIAGPWYVGMHPDDLMRRSQATVTYRCHPLWITQIDVYP